MCEGYTDVIALHQAGMRNVVGLMGTALTGEQVGELARMAQTVLLALDADSAGQEAMLKAFKLANKRKLELRVVMLPAGADPAELIQRDGAAAMQSAVEGSISFVRFRAERVLASGDPSDTEDQDRMIDELRPVFAELPESALRMELTRTVDSRMALKEGLAEKLLAAAPRVSQRRGEPGGVPARGDGDSDPASRAPAARQRDDAPRGDRARVPGAVHRLARRKERWRWRGWTSTSTSPAGCCGARPGTCLAVTCVRR